MRTITVTEGLTELKLLDARIDKAIVNANFCGAAKNHLIELAPFPRRHLKIDVRQIFSLQLILLKIMQS